MSEKMKRDEGCFDPIDSCLEHYYWSTYENDHDAVCENCVYRIEEHSYPLNSAKKPKIRNICTRRSKSFTDGNEVQLNGFCRYFTPRKTQPPKDDKLEIVYHGHTVVLSNTTDGIRVEIKEKKDE